MNMPQAASLHPDNLIFLQQHVYTRSGIVLADDKQYLLEARLGPLVRDLGMRSLDDLCAVLRASANSTLHNDVVEAMTTNETYFFREPQHFDALRDCILPELIEARRDTRKLTFWSAAASSGQEAYSLAMLLLEKGLEDWNIQIVGTDLSGRMLRQAESGRYSQIEVNRGLPVSMLLRHFRKVGLNWEIGPGARKMTHFRSFDLRSNLAVLGPFDVVLCRNVLIYFDLDTRRKILRGIHGTLFRGGRLLLGCADSTGPPEAYFSPEKAGSATIYVAQ
jgi:chemotaxis protein methyltransferase CheR